MGKGEGHCYMWDEQHGKRGANEVGSCLLDFVKKNVENRKIEEFRFCSDNCAGQNRNRIISIMHLIYVYLSFTHQVNIYHRFLESGQVIYPNNEVLTRVLTSTSVPI